MKAILRFSRTEPCIKDRIGSLWACDELIEDDRRRGAVMGISETCDGLPFSAPSRFWSSVWEPMLGALLPKDEKPRVEDDMLRASSSERSSRAASRMVIYRYRMDGRLRQRKLKTSVDKVAQQRPLRREIDAMG